MKTTYVLQLEDNKWYIGVTINLKRRIYVHKNYSNVKWVQKYKYVKLHEIIDGDVEKETTIRYMKEYGWENVRGAGWVQVNFLNPPVMFREEGYIVKYK